MCRSDARFSLQHMVISEDLKIGRRVIMERLYGETWCNLSTLHAGALGTGQDRSLLCQSPAACRLCDTFDVDKYQADLALMHVDYSVSKAHMDMCIAAALKPVD